MTPYYDHDGITIYHGDCLGIMPELNCQVMVTDPPYGINFSSGHDGHWKNSTIANDESTKARDEALEQWGDRPALVFGCWQFPVAKARMALVWDKGGAVGMGDLSIPWRPNWEMIFVLGKGFSGRRDSGVVSGHHSLPSKKHQARQHPNMKPVGLMKFLISKCPPGTILDPFLGSGSTLVAAKGEGRKAIGIEIEERYCEIAVNRLAQGVLPFGD